MALSYFVWLLHPVSEPLPYKKGVEHKILLSGLFCKLGFENKCMKLCSPSLTVKEMQIKILNYCSWTVSRRKFGNMGEKLQTCLCL